MEVVRWCGGVKSGGVVVVNRSRTRDWYTGPSSHHHSLSHQSHPQNMGSWEGKVDKKVFRSC